MHFHDDSLFPENQEKLVIQAAPYGPEWLPGDADDLPLTMDEHVQAAVDCYNAGATVLHIHVRELDGKGSKRMSMFNELLGRLREAVPDMVLQIGGSISFAPEGEGGDAKWLAYDTRHLLAELTPAPDQVTIAINANQMNIVEIMTDDDLEGTSIAKPEYYRAYRDMVVEAGPDFYLEHLERLHANGVQPHFQLATIAQLETVERLIRTGVHTGPLVLNYVAIGGGFAGRHPADLIEFIRRVPDGAVLTIESSMRAVAPMNAIAIALGVHVRVGNEDNLWRRKGEPMSSVEQVEQMVRIADSLGRDIATGPEARKIYKIGEYYADADEAIGRLGMVPNRRAGQRGFMLRDLTS
ncbi:3-keto-5-aminohexanoate cleavage protein [Streptomyces sp. NPDC005803]|uniref:3-keto-5-aminohexanoate cleavage protein n=1 Tax=Streptomyces sp. NPDC005803 TaxID=3154297 RepID=UPI0033F06D21